MRFFHLLADIRRVKSSRSNAACESALMSPCLISIPLTIIDDLGNRQALFGRRVVICRWQHGKIDELLGVEIGGHRSFLPQQVQISAGNFRRQSSVFVEHADESFVGSSASAGVILNLSVIILTDSARLVRIQATASSSAEMVFWTLSRLIHDLRFGSDQAGGRNVHQIANQHKLFETPGHRFVIEGRREHGAGNLLACE